MTKHQPTRPYIPRSIYTGIIYLSWLQYVTTLVCYHFNMLWLQCYHFNMLLRTSISYHFNWWNIGCLCAAYVALPQRSVPACLGRLEAAASHRILVSYAPRGSLDGVPTGPLLVIACIALRGCLPCPWPMRSFALAFIAHIWRFLKT